MSPSDFVCDFDYFFYPFEGPRRRPILFTEHNSIDFVFLCGVRQIRRADSYHRIFRIFTELYHSYVRCLLYFSGVLAEEGGINLRGHTNPTSTEKGVR